MAVKRGFKVGFLYRDAWWKQNHEQAAISYYEQGKRLKEQSSKGADSTAKRYSDLRQSCLDYFPQAYAEKGITFIGAPMRVVAETIREIALRERPDDFVSPQGDALKLRWFIETLEKFQAEGAFGEAIKDAMRGPTAL